MAQHALFDQVSVDLVVQRRDRGLSGAIEHAVEQHALFDGNIEIGAGETQRVAQMCWTDRQRFRIEHRRAGEYGETMAERVQRLRVANVIFCGEFLQRERFFEIARIHQRKFLLHRAGTRLFFTRILGARFVEARQAILDGHHAARRDIRTAALDLAQRFEIAVLLIVVAALLGEAEQLRFEIVERRGQCLLERARTDREHAFEQLAHARRQIAAAGQRQQHPSVCSRRRHPRSGLWLIHRSPQRATRT